MRPSHRILVSELPAQPHPLWQAAQAWAQTPGQPRGDGHLPQATAVPEPGADWPRDLGLPRAPALLTALPAKAGK